MAGPLPRPGWPAALQDIHPKLDPQRWLTTLESAKLTGGYVDPRAGRISFRDYAEDWRSRQLWRESTAARVESDLRVHLYPAIGSMPLAAVRPSDLDVLVKTLAGKLAASTVEGAYRLAATVFKSAIRDRIVTTTPCVDVKLPEKPRREVVPLTVEQVADLAGLVPTRYRGLIVLGAGCGLRLSEAFGVTVDRVNFLGRMVTVDRQLVTPPKSGRHGSDRPSALRRTGWFRYRLWSPMSWRSTSRSSVRGPMVRPSPTTEGYRFAVTDSPRSSRVPPTRWELRRVTASMSSGTTTRAS